MTTSPFRKPSPKEELGFFGKQKIFFTIFLGILIFFPLLVSAAGLVPCGGEGEPACQLCHFFVLFKNVVDFLLTKIIPPLAVLMIAIGGFMYVFAYLSPAEALPGGGKGGPALLSQAKKLIISVVFGLLIIFAAWIIVNTFFQFIGVADWTGLRQGWWKIDCPAVGSTTPTATTSSELVITTVSLANAKAGETYSQKLEASGGQTPYSWSIESGNLPTGLTLDSAGNISGKTDSTEEYNLIIKVTDTSSPSKTATKNFTIKIAPSGEKGIGETPKCVKVYGNGPVAIEFIAKSGEIIEPMSCNSYWNPDMVKNEEASWVSAVDKFKSVLDNFPPFDTQYFTIYRSNIPDTSACPNWETIYLLNCNSNTSFAPIGGHTVGLPTNVPVGSLAHELGHSFAGLCDEYEDASMLPKSGCANCCSSCPPGIIFGRCHSKWPSVCYEGCNYRTTGWYRDAENDIMNGCLSIGCSFGPVDTAVINKKLGK